MPSFNSTINYFFDFFKFVCVISFHYRIPFVIIITIIVLLSHQLSHIRYTNSTILYRYPYKNVDQYEKIIKSYRKQNRFEIIIKTIFYRVTIQNNILNEFLFFHFPQIDRYLLSFHKRNRFLRCQDPQILSK
jgi:hypothetical protein